MVAVAFHRSAAQGQELVVAEPNLAASAVAAEFPVHSIDLQSVGLVLYHAQRTVVQFQWLVAVASAVPSAHQTEVERWIDYAVELLPVGPMVE